ncbi:MAG: glycosyltransferase family 4 protein [Rhizobiaceae bacterium]
MNIVHLTSAHPRFDTRIFVKQCRSLKEAGHDVTLVVADGMGSATRHGVKIIDVGAATGRISRMLSSTRRVIAAARASDFEVCHIHDPELLAGGLSLKRRGRKVVYDAHEDLPRQIMTKTYLPSLLRRPVAGAAEIYERFICRRLDGVVAATPAIRDRFLSMGCKAIDINNYPDLRDVSVPASSWSAKTRGVCYIGSISAGRGVRELVQAAVLLDGDTRIHLAGKFSEKATEREARAHAGWSRIVPHGHVGRAAINGILARSIAGVVTLHPTSSYVQSLPVKMFEYMAASIPVVASDFPLWRQIAGSEECGIFIDPMDPSQIASAINYLVANQDEARRMGANGRRLVETKYNWKSEEKKLIELYQRLACQAR